jgi:hypothetical protein
MIVLRAAVLSLFVLTLTSCGDLSQTQHTILGDELPGLGDLGHETKEEKADAAWWHSYYGHKSDE